MLAERGEHIKKVDGMDDLSFTPEDIELFHKHQKQREKAREAGLKRLEEERKKQAEMDALEKEKEKEKEGEKSKP